MVKKTLRYFCEGEEQVINNLDWYSVKKILDKIDGDTIDTAILTVEGIGDLTVSGGDKNEDDIRLYAVSFYNGETDETLYLGNHQVSEEEFEYRVYIY